MAEKKLTKRLTKVQKEILTTLRDNPEARVKCEYNNVYRLYIGNRRERTIIWDTWMFLRTWLKEEPKRDNFGRKFYTFKPGAEISDAWRLAEIERQRAEAERIRQERQEEEARKLQELNYRLKRAIEELASGQIREFQFYTHSATFEYQGKQYVIREENS